MKLLILLTFFSLSLSAREITETDFSINPYTGEPTHVQMNSYGSSVDLTDHVYLRRESQEFNIALSRNLYADNHLTIDFSSSNTKDKYKKCVLTQTHYLPTSLLREMSDYYSWKTCIRKDLFFKYIVKSLYLDFSLLPALEKNQTHRFIIKVIKVNRFEHKYKFRIVSSDYYERTTIASTNVTSLIKYKSINKPSYAEINEDQFIFKPIQK